VANFMPDELLGFSGKFPPKACCVAKVNITVIDPKVNGLFGLSLHQNGIITSPFQLWGPPSSGLSLAVTTRKGREGSYRESASPGNPTANQWTRGEYQQILGLQGFDSCWALAK
jgi:hypothetical protein